MSKRTVAQPSGASASSTADVTVGISATPSGVIERHRFRAVDAATPAAFAPAIEFKPFVRDLEKALTTLACLPCRIVASDHEGPDASDHPVPEASAESIAWYTAPDGSRLGVALSTMLAEALVSLQYGGGLTGDSGRLGATASVVRLQAALIELILRTAAASWLAVECEWTAASIAPAPPQSAQPLHAHLISVGALRCPLGIAVALAGSVTTTPFAWAHDLRRSLDRVAFPFRAVLFETRLPLATAAQLRPGDVLPIETPRDVGLRVGTYRLAAGTIAPTDDGGHLVTIRANARPFRQPLSEKAPQ